MTRTEDMDAERYAAWRSRVVAGDRASWPHTERQVATTLAIAAIAIASLMLGFGDPRLLAVLWFAGGVAVVVALLLGGDR